MRGGALKFGAKCAQQRKHMNLVKHGEVKHEKRSGSDRRAELRKKFAESGLKDFCEREVVELLLTLSLANPKSGSVADAMLETFGSVRGIFEANVSELTKLGGVGESVAVSFQIIRAINTLYLRRQIESTELNGSIEPIVKLLKNRMFGCKVEVFEIAYFDKNMRMLNDGIERMETGTVSLVTFYSCKVVRSAVSRRSSSIIISHNHPSGNVGSSRSDTITTMQLSFALKCSGVKLADHIIMAPDGSYLSFMESGLFKSNESGEDVEDDGDDMYEDDIEEMEGDMEESEDGMDMGGKN
jgi:DNA repair protein RadC